MPRARSAARPTRHTTRTGPQRGSPGAAAEQLRRAIDELIGDDGGRAANGATTLLDKSNVNDALQKLEHAVEALQASMRDGEAALDSSAFLTAIEQWQKAARQP